MSSHDAHSGMNEPTIICPNCKTEIKLTESLAAPLIAATRQGYEQKIAQKEADVAKREAAIREQQAEITKAQDSIDEQVTAKLKTEREDCGRGGGDVLHRVNGRLLRGRLSSGDDGSLL
jgi:hypothetical protein